MSCAQNESWSNLLEPGDLSPFGQPTGEWMVSGDVSLDSQDERRLLSNAGAGVVHNGKGNTENLITEMVHGDIEAHIEFMVPAKSNSGIYFQGRYEIQVLDSWGVENPKHSDCGGIYQRWKDDKGYEGHPPRTNAARKPGEWQTFDVVFRAPRFDQEGSKTANAVFVKVVHNGILIHENQEVSGPTRSGTFDDEKPTGPLMFQGDHGPVAYRNIRIRSIMEVQ